jgi:hypothetical protein
MRMGVGNLNALDLDKIGSWAEILSALAVLVMLVYLAVQIRQANKQLMLQSVLEVWKSLDGFCDLIAQSEEVSSIVIRGRVSLAGLSESEQLRFEHVHIRMVNAIETFLMVIEDCYPRGRLRVLHMENVKAIVSEYFDHPGTLEYLQNFNSAFAPPELNRLFAELSDLDAQQQ